MLKLAIRNLAKNALDDLAGERLFADTDKGKFVLRAASYADELAYLVIQLHKRGKLTWSKDKFGRYVARYKGLGIEVHDDNSLKSSLVVILDKDRHVLSKSPLVAALAHDIWHALDVPHVLLSSDVLKEYYDIQREVAEKVIDVLKSK